MKNHRRLKRHLKHKKLNDSNTNINMNNNGANSEYSNMPNGYEYNDQSSPEYQMYQNQRLLKVNN